MLRIRSTGTSGPRTVRKPRRDAREITLLLAAPRGFCAGVRRAIDAVNDALRIHGPPVYVRRPIVHNLDVVRELEAKGAIFIEELDEAPDGSVVLFSAHGVGPEIARDARRRRMVAYDAVCPLVAKVHRQVGRHERAGRQLVLVGHAGHPEIDGTLGHVRQQPARVVNSVEEVEALSLDPDAPTAYSVQTTYSVEEARAVVAALRKRFADLRAPASSDICYATTNRQVAAREVAAQADATIVVGEGFSSNANRLLEVAARHCRSAQLVAGPADIAWSRLRGASVIGLTAAASTPDGAIEAVVDTLRSRFSVTVREVEAVRETVAFKRLDIG